MNIIKPSIRFRVIVLCVCNKWHH